MRPTAQMAPSIDIPLYSMYKYTMKQFDSIITANTLIAKDYYEMAFRWDKSTGIPAPGQFLTFRGTERTTPLLRRPFALSSFEKETQTSAIIYQVRGSATRLMKEKKPGETVNIAGPFGNSFSSGNQEKLHIVVAGGIGLGPMLYWASWLTKQGKDVIFVFGCRDESLVPAIESFENLSPAVCTDDGSRGYKGTTVDYLKTLSPDKLAGARFYGCGPHPMLKACHRLAEENGAECQVSMEEIMACGVGACMGCIIETIRGYERVCKEGAIFNSKDIKWD